MHKLLLTISLLLLLPLFQIAADNNDLDDEEPDAVFEIAATNYNFSEEEITVSEGDLIELVVYNSQGQHDLVIDEFNVDTGLIPTGGSVEVRFVADETGEFEYYCSVGSHRQAGMEGTLIVE